MKKLTYTIEINASATKAYNYMLGLENKKTYESWTAEFNPTSTYTGSWDKGSRIDFTGIDEEGNLGGMMGKIAENTPNEFVSIQYLGIIENGKEITSGEKVETWINLLENYTFEEKNGNTKLTVNISSPEEYTDYFNEAWNKALTKLKSLIEND